jgi:hypothetical protein
MDNNQTTGGGQGSTGTRDVTYDLTAVLYHALQGVENCQTYMGDAQGKQEHRQFFQQAIQAQKQLAEQAKQLLHDALMEETGGSSGGSMGQQGMGAGGGSAFRFASGQTEGGSDQFEGGSEQDRQGGSAFTSGQQVGGMGNDPESSEFGQSALGQGQRHNEMTTGGGGTSSF